MNHPSEWQKIYHPRIGRYVFRHKGTGVITDSLFNIGKAVKKTIVGLFKQAGKKVAEKGINKASDVVVKKAGDKIGNILRKRSNEVGRQSRPSQPKVRKKSTQNKDMQRLNNLLSQL